MKAIIYTRVSTDEQADKGYSLPYQKERLEQYCNIHNIEIIKHYQEDHSAQTFDRPEYKKLLEFARQNKSSVNLILVVKWDRFARNAGDALMQIRNFRNVGIKVDAIEQPIDSDIPQQKLMLAFYLMAPEVENDIRALNTFNGMRRAMKSGRWVSGAPIGYTIGRDAVNKPILLVNEKAALVKEAFELYSTGLYDREEVRKKLALKGLKYGKNGFCKMLNNSVYCGKIFIKAWKDEPEEYILGLHEPIITEELFNKVQMVASGKKVFKANPAKRTEVFPLRGYLICSSCGKNLTGSISSGKCGGKYLYYHCQPGCKERHKADVAFNTFTEWLDSITLKPEIAVLYKAIIADVYKSEIGDAEKQIERLNKLKNDTDEKLNSASRQFVEGRLDKDTFNRARAGYQNELTDYTTQIAELKTTDNNIQGYSDYVFTLLSNLTKGFNSTSIEGKQKFLSSMFPYKLIFDGKKYRTPQENEVLSLLFNNNKALEGVKIKKVGKITDQSLKVAHHLQLSNSFKQNICQIYALREYIPLELLLGTGPKMPKAIGA